MRVSLFSPCLCMFCKYNVCYDELPVCEDCANRLYSLLRDPCKTCGKTVFECDCPNDNKVRYLFFYGSYDSKRIIYSIKNDPEKRTVGFFADMIICSVGVDNKRFDAITYVPRRKQTVRLCGFDQAKAIAEAVSAKTGVPVVRLIEHTGVRSQKLLSRGERVKNIKNSYRLKYTLKEKHKKILLVDDVVTTGATMKWCAELLRSGAARAVVPVAIAKTNLALRKNI